ncbi:MAG: asparagine synthase (glutamine-hydrolyzing) [Bacteroidetes bacterium]|nr:MAG: asparagine synthase (glutamine-hydrolyzing) [Bacteroidota bacterium]
MCGIAGFNWVDNNKIAEITETLNHRGPNDTGYHVDNSVSLGQKRLSILDLSDAGHQPMFYTPEKGACSSKYKKELIANSKTGIVFNGEIYNFKEIRTQLQNKNYVFTTNCDTELVLAAYLEWGTKCVEKFNGMWAFCIYDKEKNILFLSRDRLGIKPLYYYQSENKFIFASELKAFYKAKIPFEINTDSLNHFFIFSCTPNDNSIIENVKKLQAAENLIYSLTENKIISRNKYWKTKFSEDKISENEASEQLYKLIDDSVKKRLLSDVEVGAFLSGGLDSSIIVYFMQKYVKNLKTFSIRFDYNDFNESAYAKIIADKFETQHFEIAFTAKDIKKLIDELPHFYDDPFGDASMIPTFLVSKVASEHVSVVLSGTGSDEIFAGYGRYSEYLTLKKLKKQPAFFKNLLVNIYKQRNPDKAAKLKQLLFTKNDEELYFKLLSDLFRGEDAIRPNLNKIKKLEKYFNQNSILNSVLNFDQNLYLSEDLLVKEDRATMAHSLEGRVPFLDHRVVEFANSLPVNLKLKYKTGKYGLKKTFDKHLPKEILYREKQGFGVPLKHYFRNELKDYAESIIFDFKDFEYFDKVIVRKMWNLHQTGKADYASLFWNIIIFNKWYSNWKY